MKRKRQRLSGPTETLLLLVLILQVTMLDVAAQSNSTEKKEKESPEAADILTKNTPEDRLYLWRKFNFINGAVADSSDSANGSLRFDLKVSPNLLFLSPAELEALQPVNPDPMGDVIRRRYLDIPETLPLNNVFRDLARSLKGHSRAKSYQNLPIPGDDEIEVLKILWVKDTATSSEIYAQLDSTVRLTAEDLQNLLERMVKRGFVERKLVSPTHGFSLFGVAEIEISGKNRKNRLYLYWPVVKKQKLITFLDSKRYLALASGRDSGYPEALQEKLIRLVK